LSRQLINEYRAELDRLRAVTGSTRETNLRPAFARLLRAWGKHDLDLVFVKEHQIRTAQGNLISFGLCPSMHGRHALNIAGTFDPTERYPPVPIFPERRIK
jgi:hypothetical protein